jgi:hypothetical protein
MTRIFQAQEYKGERFRCTAVRTTQTELFNFNRMYRLWRANKGCTRGPLFIEYTEERLRKKEREDKREREVVAGVKENILGKRSQSKAENSKVENTREN